MSDDKWDALRYITQILLNYIYIYIYKCFIFEQHG